MRARAALTALATLLVLLAAPAAIAGTTRPVLDVTEGQDELSGHVEYLADAGANRTLSEVLAAPDDDWFVSAERDPNFGFTSSAYWIRLRAHNPADRPTRAILTLHYPLLDEVDAYVEDGDDWRHLTLGDARPFTARTIPYRRSAMPLELEPGQSLMVYLRVATESSMQLGMSSRPLYEFIGAATRDDLLSGMYYGIMLVMALYNLFLYLVIRSRAYLLYVVFVINFIGTQMALDGSASRYLLPETPELANLLAPLLVSSLQIPILWFTETFLGTRERLPRTHYAVTAYAAVIGGGGIVLALVAPYAVAIRYAAAGAIGTSVLCEIVGIMAWRTGYRPARFYVLAWSALIIGAIGFSLTSFGVLPANTLTVNILRLGSALEVTLLSFALGDQIKLIEQEREQARAAALSMEQDLALTAAVQQMLLPPGDVLDDDDVRIVGFYRPATRCGGDWWWYERLPDGRVLVLLGDVTGHGAGAAMMTAAVAAAYQSAPSEVKTTPEVLLAQLDTSFSAIAGGLHHMSMVAVRIDPEARTLSVWSAGGPPVFVFRASGEMTPLIAPGRLMGDGALELGEASCELGAGDRVVLFSDGIPELVRPNGRQLGYAGFQRAVARTLALDLVASREPLIRDIDARRGAEPQDDDYTFVMVELP